MGIREEVTSVPIKVVSEMLGLPVPTIRSWERRYGFPEPARTPGLHRRYSPRTVEQLRAVRDEIARGIPVSAAVDALREADATGGGPAERYVNELAAAAAALDPERIRSLLVAATDDLGVDTAVQDAALPALRRVGTMWETGKCDVENEHVITAEMREWFAVLGRRSRPDGSGTAAPVLLACGPEDAHSMGLEAFAALLKRRGVDVVMLGPLTPTESFLRAMSIKGAPAGVVTSHQNLYRRAATGTIKAAATMPGVRVFYAGAAFQVERNRKGLPGTYLGEDLPAAADRLQVAVA